MSESVECSVCGKEFDGENPLQQHKQAKHSEEVSTPDWGKTVKTAVRYAIYGAGALALAFVIAYWIVPWLNQPGQQALPSQGDHWHARYSIVLCGEKIPPRPYSKGGMHTHGKGRIHIHPHSPATAGENADLATFFESFNGELTNKKIAVPMVGTYKNGDKCNGKPGEVAVYVNGTRVSNPASYVPQDGDIIQIKFQPKS